MVGIQMHAEVPFKAASYIFAFFRAAAILNLNLINHHQSEEAAFCSTVGEEAR